MNYTIYTKYSGILPDGDEFDIKWVLACFDQTHDEPGYSDVVDTTYYINGSEVEENIFPLKSWYVDVLSRDADRDSDQANYREPEDDEPFDYIRLG